MEDGGQFNLTPSTRVLRMLGRIDFKPWQCLAELIDNSVDAFLSAREKSEPGDGNRPLFPQVSVELSSAVEIRAGRGELRISDNGPGMTYGFLEDAVRAGYSSNDSSADKLGLFGMGFNVATARLGTRTEVWTTRLEDDAWYGVRIDFDDMEKAHSFLVPALRRPKTASEMNAHGTQVVITKLDRERALYLRSGGGLRSTKEKLSRVYNKIMREIGLEVVLVGTPLTSREFCVWAPNRYVETKGEFGRIPVRLDIDADLGSRLYCDDCWIWLEDRDAGTCPVCQKSDQVLLRDRRVRGWLGIQRFFSQTDYGIDLIRNGRVIEERSKSFFTWRDPETDEAVLEYPLEQTHWGGRIVGELTFDFVPLASHQKDAFDKTSREWRVAEEVVRGRGPIIQKYRQQLGLLDRNTSPLARLHAGYRRGQPAGLRTLVPGDAKGRGFNRPPEQWAALFWAGDPEYQTDEKWYEAVLRAEEVASGKKGVEVPPDITGDDLFPGAEDDETGGSEDGSDAGAPEPTPAEPEKVEDPSMCNTFELPDLPGGLKIEVTAEKLVSGRLPNSRHIDFATIANRSSFVYDPRHALFVQSLVEPADCLVQELAYQFLVRASTVTQTEYPLSLVITWLRQRYFPWTLDSFQVTRDDAQALLIELVEFFVEALAPLEGQHEETLTDEERKAIGLAVARIDHQGAERVDEVIWRGEYPRYLGHRCLPKLVRTWPELVLDSQFFDLAYADVDPPAQEESIDAVVVALGDLIWVANPDGPQVGGVEWRGRLGRAINSLRLLQGWKVVT